MKPWFAFGDVGGSPKSRPRFTKGNSEGTHKAHFQKRPSLGKEATRTPLLFWGPIPMWRNTHGSSLSCKLKANRRSYEAIRANSSGVGAAASDLRASVFTSVCLTKIAATIDGHHISFSFVLVLVLIPHSDLHPPAPPPPPPPAPSALSPPHLNAKGLGGIAAFGGLFSNLYEGLPWSCVAFQVCGVCVVCFGFAFGSRAPLVFDLSSIGHRRFPELSFIRITKHPNLGHYREQPVTGLAEQVMVKKCLLPFPILRMVAKSFRTISKPWLKLVISPPPPPIFWWLCRGSYKENRERKRRHNAMSLHLLLF